MGRRHFPGTPASPSPPEAASFSSHVDLLLRFTAIMLTLLAIAALPQSSFFSITAIDVRGARQISAGDIVVRSGVRAGQPRSTVQAAEIAARVRTLPRIESAEVTVEPSGRIRIVVTERRPVAAVSYGHIFLLVDAAGVVVENRSDNGGFTELRIEGMTLPWVKVGEELPARQVGAAIGVLQLLPPSVKRGLNYIAMSSEEEFSVSTGGQLVLLGALRGLGERAAVLAQVLSALSEQKIAVEYVDLRFLDNVVLRPVTQTSAGGDGR